jgi:FeS assembly SUF system protein|tara:strand:- start:3400 stop:3699 length:300 start_codon:yes stop_codon:yes gene_type:complete
MLKNNIIDALKQVHDPELPVNIYDLGLIYSIELKPGKHVDITMTLTNMGCPVAGYLVQSVEVAAKSVEGIETAYVDLVFDPPWNQNMLSEAAKLELGIL